MSNIARSTANAANTFARGFPLEPFISKAKQAKGMAAMPALAPASISVSGMCLGISKYPKCKAPKLTTAFIGLAVPIAAKMRLNMAILVASRLRLSGIGLQLDHSKSTSIRRGFSGASPPLLPISAGGYAAGPRSRLRECLSRQTRRRFLFRGSCGRTRWSTDTRCRETARHAGS